MVLHATQRSVAFTDQRTLLTVTRHDLVEKRVRIRTVLCLSKATWEPTLCHDSVDA